MMLKKTVGFFLLATLLLCTTTHVSSVKKHVHKKKVVIVNEPKCIEDKGEAAGLIREAILAGDFNAIAEIFEKYCGEANLARGFDFEGSEDLLQPTEDRLNDPDIVSFKALALHSIQTKEYERLADIFLFALFGNDLITLETDYKCACSEKIVDQKAEAFVDDVDHKILAKYKAEVNGVKNSTSMWKINASASTTTLDYNDPDAIGCQWSATIKVTCKDVSEVRERKLTDEEIAEKKNDLIADFSDEAYMQSILDNSYFSDLVQEPVHGRRRKLAMRELLLASAQSVVSSICYVCDPEDTCKEQLSDCA